MTAVLEVTNVHAGYGQVEVLRDISINVQPGEAVGLFGPNGHGKTTLFNVVSGLLRSSNGTVHFQGADMTNATPRRMVDAGLVHVPQGSPLFPRLTVEENLELAAYNRRSWRDRRAQVAKAYERFPRLAERSENRAQTLSGGERQMLAISMGLMANPTLLMLDEPTLGLAPRIRQEVGEGLTQILGRDLAVLIVDQDVELLKTLTDRMYLIEEGSVESMIGQDDELSTSEVIARYFGADR